ncbi:hypothetical protein [Natronobiforma cellulositropha]|uniref:hypothetical protein n=1 Tax=Natronobiforma cellulositropha TaxID=1679076 RepID=UPI0021D58160|nr:hypothetical protein [Natronobiforma cellulositropha]
MSQEQERHASNGFELRQFEKNRYFQGKLMTARDMRVEQEYHTDRLQTANKLIAGSGIVSGLTISELEDHGDGLRVTVEPGVAIDYQGRPIVVKNSTTTRFPTPDGDEMYIHIAYEEETKDPVPVPGGEPLSGEESEESRILEVFDITYRETPPSEYKTVPHIEFPDLQRQGASDPTAVANALAEAYHENARAEVDGRTDPSVFLGSFKRTPDGEWKPGQETRRRPFVYDNDMLYAALIAHIADTDNPHRTTVGEPTDYIEGELDQIEGFAIRLERLQSNIEALSRELEVHNDYATQKSLKTTVRYFDDVADRFDDSAQATRIAFAISASARDALESGVETDEQYLEFVEAIAKNARELEPLLEGRVTESGHDQYTAAVDALEEALEAETSVLQVAVSLDELSETADLLETRYGVVPEDEA